MSRKLDKTSFPYEALMDLHQDPPVPDRSYWESLEARAGKSGVKILSFEARKRFFLGLSAAAAAVFLLAVLLPRSLGLPITVATDSSSPVTSGERGIFEAQTAPLKLQTRGETLVLFPGSRLKGEPLGQGTAFHSQGNRYYLETGKVEIRHTDPATTFELVTPFGKVQPLGTSLTAQLSEVSLLLVCQEGRIRFESTRGEVRILEAGSRLVWPEKSISEVSSPGEPPPLRRVDPPVPSEKGETRSPEYRLIKRWSRPLNAQVQEAVFSEGRWIIRLPGAAEVLHAGTGRLEASWKPGSDLWVSRGNELIDYEKGLLRSLSSSGTLLWEVPVPPLSLGRLSLGPSGILAATAQGTLVVVEREAGTEISRLSLGAGSYGEPLEWEGRVYVSTLDRKFHAWDLRTGTRLWTADLLDRLVGDRPSVWKSLVLVKDRAGKLWALDRKDGKVRWTLETGLQEQPGILALPDNLFIATSQGTQVTDVQGASRKWEGGRVLGARTLSSGGWITLEPEGIFLTREGVRRPLHRQNLVWGAAQGEGLLIQGEDLEVTQYEVED